MKLEIGQKAPGFSLFNSEKNKVTLSDFKGKNVLILFFPQAFTSVCTAELCAVRDDISRYDNINSSVIGISVDSVFTLKQYKTNQGYNFTLLSDFNKEVSASYGSLYEEWILDMKGVSKRSAFIVDKEGRINYAEVLENASDVPNFRLINEKLISLSD
ncbi:MAG: redoxin domain-containing protein [Chitinophagaceae bacterium]|nr:redoxin domain-containing protein [Chitinophagaceae bacterium]